MKSIARFLLAGALAGVMAGVASQAARAAVVYDFEGDCAVQCAPGVGTGVLTLADTYSPGTPVSLADFISWSYSSSTGSYDVTSPALLLSIDGTLPAVSGMVPLTMDFEGSLTFFFALESGWRTVYGSSIPMGNTMNPGDNGSTYTWTLRSPSEVPLPAALPLLAAGIGLLGFAGWRRRRSSTGRTGMPHGAGTVS